MIFPQILGDYYSYQDIELNANGLQFAGVKNINYKDSLSRVKVRGTAVQPLGLSVGRYEATGDLEMYLDASQLLITSLGPNWRRTPIFITIVYGPKVGLSLPLIVDEIPGCFIGDFEASNAEGDDPLTRRATLHIPGQILWGGIPSIIEAAVFAAVA